jgi:hypothetical protein
MIPRTDTTRRGYLLTHPKTSRSRASCSLDRFIKISDAPVDLDPFATTFDVITYSAAVPEVRLPRTLRFEFSPHLAKERVGDADVGH